MKYLLVSFLFINLVAGLTFCLNQCDYVNSKTRQRCGKSFTQPQELRRHVAKHCNSTSNSKDDFALESSDWMAPIEG